MNIDHIHAAAAVRLRCDEQRLAGGDSVTVPRAVLEKFLEMHDAYEAARSHLVHWTAHADLAMEDAAAFLALSSDAGDKMLARRLAVAREKLTNIGSVK